MLDGVVAAGAVLEARLKSVGRNAVAVADGQEYLLPKGAPGVTEGAAVQHRGHARGDRHRGRGSGRWHGLAEGDTAAPASPGAS